MIQKSEEDIRVEERHLVTKAFLQVLMSGGLINTGNTQPILRAVNELADRMREVRV